jgi:hypothetical protein
MPRAHARVVLNRGALTEIGLAVADGLEVVTRTVVEQAEPPDATPYGEGLVTQGGWLVYHGTKKVAGGSLRGRQPKKPRGMRLAAKAITAIAGFGFPGRLQETGTIHHPAQPFVWPAWLGVEPRLPRLMAPAVQAHLARFGRRFR